MRFHYALVFALLLCTTLVCSGGTRAKSAPSSPTTVIVNDDPTAAFGNNSISYFRVGGSPPSPTLTYQNSVPAGGIGAGGSNFGASSIVSQAGSNAQCLYVSNAGSGQIGSVNIQSQQLAGVFTGSVNDAGTSNGIGLALNQNYLYASFTDSNTIGTFEIMPGCQLSFVGDTSTGGLNGGGIYAIAVHGNILVATFGDGSIQSFNIAGGTPASNNDLQNSTGYIADYNNLPAGIDITQDGHYAIFGDGAILTVVEVSDISSGRLSPTRVYNLGAPITAVSPVAVLPGNASANVRLSPDEQLLFISNNQSGNITLGFFNPGTGAIAPGCTSPKLKGYYSPWFYLGSMVTENTSGSGGVLYVAEYGNQSSIGILNVTTGGGRCSFSEPSSSPVQDPANGAALLSLWAYPPRTF